MPVSLGPAEIVVILVVALIVLGPKRLPEAGRQVGKAVAEVRRWSQGMQDDIRDAFDPEPETPPMAPRPVADDAVPTPSAPSAGQQHDLTEVPTSSSSVHEAVETAQAPEPVPTETPRSEAP